MMSRSWLCLWCWAIVCDLRATALACGCALARHMLAVPAFARTQRPAEARETAFGSPRRVASGAERRALPNGQPFNAFPPVPLDFP